jgi:hypothetical protein
VALRTILDAATRGGKWATMVERRHRIILGKPQPTLGLARKGKTGENHPHNSEKRQISNTRRMIWSLITLRSRGCVT